MQNLTVPTRLLSYAAIFERQTLHATQHSSQHLHHSLQPTNSGY